MSDISVKTVFMLASLAMAAGFPASAQETVGEVIFTRGDVSVTSPHGTARQAERQTSLRQGDVLTTAAGGFVRLTLHDASMISLPENTEFHLLEILSEKPWQGITARYRLVRGGLRTIGGTGRYRVETPFAAVETRAGPGGTFECHLAGHLDCGVYDGTLLVQNAAGALGLGGANNYDFARVSGSSQVPAGTLYMPGSMPGLPPAPPRRRPAGPLLQIPSGPAAGNTAESALPAPAAIRIEPTRR